MNYNYPLKKPEPFEEFQNFINKMFFIFWTITFCDEKTPSGILISNLSQKIDDFIKPLLSTALPSSQQNLKEETKSVLAILLTACSLKQDHTTGWSAAQLYEAGKLSFDEDIENYLGKNFFKRRKYNKRITLLHLFHHSTGWDDVIVNLYAKWKKMPELSKYLQTIEPYQFEPPGKHVAYSNYAISIEGLIVEKVSGESYIEYIHNHIFKVLGMNSTSIDPIRADLPNINQLPKATGYLKYHNGKFIEDTSKYIFTLYPAGAAIGPIYDLSRFINELIPKKNYQCKLFKKVETLELLLNVSHRSCEECSGNAYGFWEDFYGGETGQEKISALGHNGNTYSFSSKTEFLPSKGWAICILTNLAQESIVIPAISSIIYGNYNHNYYHNKSYLKMKGNVDMIEGYYKALTTVNHGILKSNLNKINSVKVKKVSDYSFELLGDKYVQLEPLVFDFEELPNETKGTSKQFFLKDDKGKINGFYQKYEEFIAISKEEYQKWIILDYFDIGIFILFGSFIIVLVIFSLCIVKIYKNDKKTSKIIESIEALMIRSLDLSFLVVLESALIQIILRNVRYGYGTLCQFLIYVCISLQILRWILIIFILSKIILFVSHIKTTKRERYPKNNGQKNLLYFYYISFIIIISFTIFYNIMNICLERYSLQ